ncbi:MAG: hypothetical protein ACYC7G_09135 [Rudaea sp.]
MRPAEIYRHSRFYADKSTGEFKTKYFLILAIVDGYVVFRPLTSQPRPEVPECHHGLPYPSFYLGVLGGGLGKKSWLDLTKRVDAELHDLRSLLEQGVIEHETALAKDVFMRALACAAGADDTDTAQEKAMRNLLATLR